MVLMDGLLIIDKPAGMTSHDVVAKVRRITAHRRVGHTGTLDPFATGVLVVLIGRATRLAQFLSGAEKEYEAVIRLGYATDTGDITGVGIESSESHAKAQSRQSFRKEEIESALASLRGEIDQTPPMYSAKKIAGRKLYELARRGEKVERKAVRVTVSEFEATALPSQNHDDTKDLSARVVCSAGTYIRTLAEDFGKRLGVGAHVAELRRTRAGRFRIEDAITLDRLAEQAQVGSLEQLVISPDTAVSFLPQFQLDGNAVRRVMNGIDIEIENGHEMPGAAGQAVRMCSANGELIAVGICDSERRTVHPQVVIGKT